MAENTEAAEGASDAQITFKVKTGSEGMHTITMAESASVLDLKTKLAGEDMENIPVERQRLIYSGRVMKNDDSLSTYKIKPNNTIHLVKSAASNPTPPAANTSSTPAAAAVPSNMSAGTTNDILTGLTGARFAGFGHLPGREIFGADGGMGAPPSEEQLAQMLTDDPAMIQTLNAALDNPQFIDTLINSNPYLRNMPNARQLIQSPLMRSMLTNPEIMRNMMRMQRGMRGGQPAAFPAPGATDTTPAGAPSSGADNATGAQNPPPFPNLSALGGLDFGANANRAGGAPNLFGGLFPFDLMAGAAPGSTAATAGTAATGTPASTGTGTTTGTAAGSAPGGQAAAQGGAQQTPDPAAAAAANPFAALFPQGGPTSEQMQAMMQMLGMGSPASPAPVDNRPPEERYAEQLRQLNDMGFYDFDRNIAALRRSGGSVQGAVEYLLSNS